MSTPFLGEIKLIAFNFAPSGWALCNGQFLPINQNQGLFSLLGTMYGGNGQTTFQLPDLRGRAPVHQGMNLTIGTRGGEEFHTVSQSEMPAHTHALSASNAADVAANTNNPADNYPANDPINAYRTTADTTFSPLAVTSVGGSQPHENRQPYLTVGFMIALQGIFPSQH